MMDKNFNLKIVGLIGVSILFLVFMIWFLLFNNLNVSSTSPANGATQVSLKSPILIYFDKNLSERQKNSLDVTSIPSFGFSSQWSEQNNSVALTPNGRLESNTKYQIKINSGGKSYSWSFTTMNEDKQDFIDQGESDKYFSDQEKNFNASHPWYSSLPHRTNDFFVGFDPLKNEFYADIYVVDKTEDQIKNDVLSYLKSIGVNTNNYKVVYTTFSSRP